MNIHQYDTLRNLVLAAVLTIGFASSALAQEVSSFFIDLNSQGATDLGTLGGRSSSASGINDMGQVVGDPTLATGSSMPSSRALMAWA